MKALINIKRITEYSTIVEMTEETFKHYERLMDGNRTDQNHAEKELNRKIDTKDWQDDEFYSLVTFERVIE